MSDMLAGCLKNSAPFVISPKGTGSDMYRPYIFILLKSFEVFSEMKDCGFTVVESKLMFFE